MKDYLISKGIEDNKVFVTGIPISLRFLEKYDKKNILTDLNFKDDLCTILFFGGGEFGLGKTKTIKIFETLVKDFTNIQIIAISGRNKKMKSSFKNIVEANNKNNTVKIFEFTDKVPELMSVSDLVITKPGGLTTSESLASGLPIIIINPIPGQEEENAEFLVEKNVGIWIKKKDCEYDILNHIISNKEILQEMKNNTNLLAKKYSTQNICDILLKE